MCLSIPTSSINYRLTARLKWHGQYKWEKWENNQQKRALHAWFILASWLVVNAYRSPRRVLSPAGCSQRKALCHCSSDQFDCSNIPTMCGEEQWVSGSGETSLYSWSFDACRDTHTQCFPIGLRIARSQSLFAPTANLFSYSYFLPWPTRGDFNLERFWI